MSEKPREHYDVEPHGEKADGSADEQGRPSSVKELDVCPNCGASMRGSDMLVCLRCGFDMKTMRVIETKTGVTETPAEGDAAGTSPPLVKPGMGGVWLPGVIAGLGGLLLLIAHLAGAPGLVVPSETGDVGLAARFESLLRSIVLLAMWTVGALGALAFQAYLMGTKLVARLDDLKLALVRVLAIAVTMRVAAIIDLQSRTLEWMAEAALGLGIFVGMSIALFRLPPRDAATLAGAALILFLAACAGAFVTVWALNA